MHSLSLKLLGALLLVVIISVGLTAYLTNRNTSAEFQTYVQQTGMMYSQQASQNLSNYYSANHSWNGVQSLLTALQRSSADRLVLADSSGLIVADTGNQWQNRTAASVGLVSGTDILVGGQRAGTLYTLTLPGSGQGFRGGMGGMMGGGVSTPTVVAVNPGQDFLSRVNNYLWVAGLIALAAALLIGVLLTRQIIRPLRALTNGAEQIARGNLGYRVKTHTGDEFGQLAQSFNAMAASLDSSEQARKRLVADVAHELRTPLTVIEGTVDAIQDGIFPADREHLETIKEQTDLLTHLAGDLRELSVGDAGQLKLQIAPTDLSELVGRKLAQFEAQAREKGVALVQTSSPPLLPVKVDSLRIEQAVSNLLSNALRHTPRGGTITASVEPVQSAEGTGREIQISITDTGEGIAPEYLPHVFERFYRAGNSRSRSEGGAGLGLAIVKQMVEAHGGKVRAESQPGRGSTFYLNLPLK